LPSKKDVALVKLSGDLIRKDGEVDRHKYFQFLDLPLQDYPEVEYTEAEAKLIVSRLSHLSTGANAAIPLVCGGRHRCPFASRCVFVQIDNEREKAKDNEEKERAQQAGEELLVSLGLQEQARKDKVTPVGKPCLVELNLLNQWTKIYMEEFDISPHSRVELGYAGELAEIELMLWRLNNNLSKPEHAELVQETVVGVDREGNPLTQIQPNAFLGIKQSLNNRKSRVIKLMVGDRQEKYKEQAATKQMGSTDPSSTAAQLKSRIERTLAQADKAVLELKKMTGEDVIDVEYIEEGEVDDSPITPEDLIRGDRDI
jgi:hypothetical protein